MIEEVILGYLDAALSVPCFMEMPEDKTDSFVVIEKIGSSITNRITKATFAIQSYGASLYDAAALNEQVKEAMDSMIVRDDISKVELNSDYNYTDTALKHYRYQAVFVVTYYGGGKQTWLIQRLMLQPENLRSAVPFIVLRSEQRFRPMQRLHSTTLLFVSDMSPKTA